MKNIPDIVKKTAEENGFNCVSYAGVLDTSQVFSVGVIDEEGNPIPMGMPTFIILKDNKPKMISGYKGLDILISLR